jgi:hypothetical protein
MIISGIRSSAPGIALAAFLAFIVLAIPAWAEEPRYPTGSSIGLVPPPGMTLAETFPGFVNADKTAGILVGILPVAAYEDMEKSLSDDTLKKQGFTVEKRESLQLNIGKAILVIGTELGANNTKYRKWLLVARAPDLTALVTVQEQAESNVYPDAVVRAALASVTERKNVPDEELLTLLPFTVGDLGGFKVANVVPGRALMLIDKDPHPAATPSLAEYDGARFIIAAMPGGPASDEERANLARVAFGSIAGIKDIHVTMAEPIRINNQQGFETVAQAKDANVDVNLVVVQWLRFGSGKFLQMVGISRADVWSAELSRLRSVRDSIVFK